MTAATNPKETLAVDEDAITLARRLRTLEAVVKAAVPRWDADPLVVANGWVDGRCGKCGEPLPAVSAPVSSVEPEQAQPWSCPNQPRCPHPNSAHDIEDFSGPDPRPMCCADGCKPTPAVPEQAQPRLLTSPMRRVPSRETVSLVDDGPIGDDEDEDDDLPVSRVWQKGDPEPGQQPKPYVSGGGRTWCYSALGGWFSGDSPRISWDELPFPLTEVIKQAPAGQDGA